MLYVDRLFLLMKFKMKYLQHVLNGKQVKIDLYLI